MTEVLERNARGLLAQYDDQSWCQVGGGLVLAGNLARVQARAFVRAGRPVLRTWLMFISGAAFVVGIVLLVTRTGDSRIFFELAAAACGIAAGMLSGT